MTVDNYIRELKEATRLIPVILPGTPVRVGDLIKFNENDGWGRPKLGLFRQYESLSGLNIPFSTAQPVTSSVKTYTSQGGITASAGTSVQDLATAQVEFSRKGALFIQAFQVSETSLVNLRKVKRDLAPQLDRDFDNAFLVYRLFTAQRVVVIQSQSQSGKVEFSLDPAPGSKAGLRIGASQGKSTVEEYVDEVSLLMDLIEIRTEFGTQKQRLALAHRENDLLVGAPLPPSSTLPFREPPPARENWSRDGARKKIFFRVNPQKME